MKKRKKKRVHDPLGLALGSSVSAFRAKQEKEKQRSTKRRKVEHGSATRSSHPLRWPERRL